MIVKKIQYHDLDGDLREDDFYFSMNEAQFARVNGMFPGGLREYAMKVAKDKNVDGMFKVVDTLVREAYGERVGSNFVKVAPNGQKLSDFFVNTEAYDNLLIELTKGEDNLMTFMTGCLNKNAQDRVKTEWAKAKEETDGDVTKLLRPKEEKPSLSVLDKQ
jgi:uncharacterized protein YciU (UPF0263 family)